MIPDKTRGTILFISDFLSVLSYASIGEGRQFIVALRRWGEGGPEDGSRLNEKATILRLCAHPVSQDFRGLSMDEDRRSVAGRLLDAGPSASRAAFDVSFGRDVAPRAFASEVFENDHRNHPSRNQGPAVHLARMGPSGVRGPVPAPFAAYVLSSPALV
jgi:hypothetical protein